MNPDPPGLPRFERRGLLAFGAICVMLAIGFWPALSGYFLADDAAFLSFVAQADADGSLGRTLWTGFFRPPFRGGNFYRPLLDCTYALDYRLWGTAAAGWHLTNLLLHLSCVALLAGVLEEILREAGAVRSWAPVAAALLFGLSPLTPESVAWIAGRTDPLALALMLASLLLYLRAPTWKSPAGAASVLFFAAALASKEVAVTLPGWIAAVHLAGGKGGPRRLVSGVAPHAAMLTVYLTGRFALFGSAFEVFPGYPAAQWSDPAWIRPRLASLVVLVRSTLTGDGAGAAMLAMSLLLFALGLVVAVKSTAARRLASVGALWAGVTLFAAARYLWVGADGEGERILYVPGIAIATLLAVPLAFTPVPGAIRSGRVLYALAILAVTARVALSVPLLHGELEDWERAGAMMRAAVVEIREEAERTHPKRRTVLFLPDQVGSAFFARNAMGPLMTPPIQPRSVEDRVLVVTAETAPGWLGELAKRGPDFGRTDFRCWKDGDGSFATMELPPEAGSDYATVRRVAAEAGCEIVASE